MGKRLLWVDYAKAVAIILMVLGHAGLPNTGKASMMVYMFHMPLFFIISGYFDNSQKLDTKDFFVRNFKTILIPYLVFNVVSIPFCAVSAYLHPELYRFTREAADFIYQPLLGMLVGDDMVTPHSYMALGALWFLMALFVVKTLFYGIQKLAVRVNGRFLPLYFTLIAVVSVAVFLCIRNRFSFWSLDSAFMALPFYMLGCLAKKKSLFDVLTKSQYTAFAICAASFVYLYFIGLKNGRIDMNASVYGNNILMFYINAVVGSIMVILMCNFVTRRNAFLSTIGEYTIVVLGMHGIGIYISKFLLKVCGVQFSADYLFYTTFSVLFCYVCIKIISRHAPVIIGKAKVEK